MTESLSESEPTDVRGGVDALDGALSRATDYDAGDCVVTMLSGGVDSTLVHTYLPEDTPTRSGAFKTPEFDFEVEYARAASGLLGTDHRVVSAPEPAFDERLEQTVDALGMPPQQLQSPTIDLCYRETDATAYVSGETADSLYGMGAWKDRVAWLTRALRHLPAVYPTLETHERKVRRLLRSPWDPRGTAQKSSQYLDLAHLGECVDESLLERRQLNRLLYVRSRIPLATDADAFEAHMDWGHWIGRLCEGTLTTYRQIAHARGKAHRAPFATRAVAEAALAVPSPARYIKGRQTKPVPKRLLARRIPDYEVTKRKGNGNLPVGRFLREGPLVKARERYDLPEFAPGSDWAAVVEDAPSLGWILLSWAVWRDRVLRREVSPVSHTRVLEA